MLRTFTNDFAELFYPSLCVVCGRRLTASTPHICLSCLCDLPQARYHERAENPMMKLYAGFPNLREAAAFLIFEKDGVARKIVHDFKYHHNKSLAEFMGRIALQAPDAAKLFRDVDFLIPVPLHPKKERQRGYNQSYHIARGIAAARRLPVRNDMLYRKIYTPTQTSKSHYDRYLNTEDVFAVKNARTCEGKHTLLVDDVITSGATSVACLCTLSAIPNMRVSIFSIAIVPQ
ncbi:MAG: ComF family protein [Tannerella sp.]|jgi:ComF family protein|nr:ComF family protein [Tannerella sp.]